MALRKKLLDEVYNFIRIQRFKDIVVIRTEFNTDPEYLILASSINSRHLINGTEEVNKNYKALRGPDQDFAKLSISPEWNVLDFGPVVAHLFSKPCRERFDVEQLWAVGEKHDDLTIGQSL